MHTHTCTHTHTHTHTRPEQEAILHLAETFGRLLLLHDKAGMGLLSERELLSAWQDIALTAGTGIPRRCIRFAARFSRVRGEQISQQSRAGHVHVAHHDCNGGSKEVHLSVL